MLASVPLVPKFASGGAAGPGELRDTSRNRRWLFLAIFALCALLGGFSISVGQMTIDNVGCRSGGYSSDDFLAYCRSKWFGDYEHGALYYGLEPAVRRNIRKASVIFLGNSKTQAAFSTKAVRAYFDKRGIRHFVMGFGYGEWSTFSLAVLKKSRAHPRVVVINADPVFSYKLANPAEEALEGSLASLWRLCLNFSFQRVHRVACYSVSFLCPESEPSFFRSTRDGQWNWIGPYIEEKAVPIDGTSERTITPEELEKAKVVGEQFLREIGLDRRCGVLTGTPNTDLNPTDFVRDLATALKTNSILPSWEGLSTLDGGHLNLASAERWSHELIESLTPILQDCMPADDHGTVR